MGLFKKLKETFVPKENTEIWQLFEAGKKHNNVRALQSEVEQAYRFFEGEQWSGLGIKEAKLQPFHNFIEPTIKHKLSNICMNDIAVVFDGDDEKACSFITSRVNDIMKKIRISKAGWDTMRAALISGNGYLFFPKGSVCAQGAHIRSERNAWQLIDSTCVFLGDETSTDIQGQPYIIIYERRSVEDIRCEARANGVDETEIGNIVCDEDTELVVTTDTRQELQNGIGRCASLVYMTIKNGVLHVARSTRHVIYQPEAPVKAENAEAEMDMYPLVGLVVASKKGSSRGRGEVSPMIPNQIEYNKNLARVLATVKNTAYPKVVYNKDAVDNPEDLSQVGAQIALNDNTGEVSKMVGYLQPAGVSGDVQYVATLMMDRTRELMNAGQAVTGEIDPEKASGTAIIAMRDQAAIPLNEMHSAFKQFYRDCAMVLYHYLIAYNPTGVNETASAMEEGVSYTTEQLKMLDLSINVEVTSVAPYSVFARDSSLEKLFGMQAISFEEYVKALDENSSVPKKKLTEILEERDQMKKVGQVEEAIEDTQDQEREQEVLASLAEKQINQYLPNTKDDGINSMEGGVENV